MEWDQIADRWAAMARRLCSDRSEGPRSFFEQQGAFSRTTEVNGGESSGRIAPEMVGNDNRLPSNQ